MERKQRLADERRFSIEFCRAPFAVTAWKRVTLASGIPDAEMMVTRY